MGLFADFVNALKRAGQAAQTHFPFKPPFEEVAELYTAATQDLRTDAALTDAEEFALLMGEKVSTRGWITQAQWDAPSATLTLWTATHGPYDFPNIDKDGAMVFAKADSKGSWYWGIWKGRAVKGPVPKKGRNAGKVGHATAIFSTVIRKKKRNRP